jgi:hypothetical protein
MLTCATARPLGTSASSTTSQRAGAPGPVWTASKCFGGTPEECVGEGRLLRRRETGKGAREDGHGLELAISHYVIIPMR